MDTGSARYPIWFRDALNGSELNDILAGRRVFILSDSNVAPLHLDGLTEGLKGVAGSATVPAGEATKSLERAKEVFGGMIESRLDRNSVLIALGGGVVGDLGGFLAATYQRGIAFLQVPTSLLAMVDSSVGGKVAVNHPLGKNMIGAFHQPEAVLVALDTLKTLPERELKAGLAEVVKYGIIADADFFDWLEQHASALLARDPETLRHAIRISLEIKARIVGEDEKEKGVRAILNLGHTYGHAEELLAGYGKVLHGEAVAAGMVAACRLAERRSGFSADETGRVVRLLEALDLPTKLSEGGDAEKFYEAMRGDKKSVGGELRLVLPEKIGSCRLPEAAPFDEVLQSIRASS